MFFIQPYYVNALKHLCRVYKLDYEEIYQDLYIHYSQVFNYKKFTEEEVEAHINKTIRGLVWRAGSKYRTRYFMYDTYYTIDFIEDVWYYLKKVLNPEEYNIIYLYFIEGLSLREVAEKIKKPKSTVTFIYNKALGKLRQDDFFN